MTEQTPRTVADLAAVTGLDPESVRKYIRVGMLPGYYFKMPGAKRGEFRIPAQAFEDFCHGRWQPVPRPVAAVDVPERVSPIRRRAS